MVPGPVWRSSRREEALPRCHFGMYVGRECVATSVKLVFVSFVL
jgi:hypothetical protein